jgi:hypothetical protein
MVTSKLERKADMTLITKRHGKNATTSSWLSQWKVTNAGKRSTQAVTLGSSSVLSLVQATRLDEGITSIRVSNEFGEALSGDQIKFLASLPDKLHRKLAQLGFARKRQATRSKDSFTLENVRNEFQEGRDVKESTLDNEDRALDLLEGFFDKDKDVRDITELEAERCAKWLRKQRLIGTGKLASSTVSGHLRKITGLFTYMVKAKLIGENPFGNINKAMKRDKSKDCVVTVEEADDYINAVEHPQWKAIIAIARYCGVRGPSDLLYMQRKHVNFDKKQVTFPSVKNGNRNCPMFPEVVEHFQWLCDREDAPNGYLFKDIEQGGHGKKCSWEGARVSGKLKDLNLRKTPNDSYRRATGKNPIPRFFKNCRATRVTDLIKKEGFSQHTVCEWIGHTEEISKNHYQMMIEEDHSRATEPKNAPKTAPKSAPTSETQNTPDSIIKQAFASLGDDQLNQLTLVLQGLADVIETQPASAHLLLTAISDEAKKPQSSSNRGRTCTPEGTGS